LNYSYWNSEDIKILGEGFFDWTREKLELKLGRRWDAIETKAQSLGLKRQKGPWSELEEEILLEKYDNHNWEELKFYFPKRSIKSIQMKSFKLGLLHKEKNILDFTNIDTEEKAYCLGFIGADGNVNKELECMKIMLQFRDVSLLCKIRDIIDPNNLIYAGSKGFTKKNKPILWCRLIVSSKEFCEQIYSHGIVPNKGYILEPPSSLPSSLVNHWVRGMFDGDGCAYIKKNCKKLQLSNFRCDIVNSIPIVEYIYEWFVRETQGRFSATISPYVCSKGIMGKFIVNGKSAIEFCKLIYKNATVYLERKYQKAEKYLIRHPKLSHNDYWSEEQLYIIEENYSVMDKKELVKIIGKDWETIKVKACRLGLKRRNLWSSEELKKLKELYPNLNLSKEEILTHFHKRNWHSLEDKASQLGIRRKNISAKARNTKSI